MFQRNHVLAALAIGLVLALVGGAQPTAPPSGLSPTVAAVQSLADSLDQGDVARRARKIVEELNPCEVSRVFSLRRPRRGGVGIGSAVKAGHRDSIEDLILDWSGRKPPTRDELQEHKKDLLRVARVLQSMAELAPYRRETYMPPNNDKMHANWQQLCAQFKTVSRDLHEAIDKGEEAQTRQVAVRLQLTCSYCHQLVGR